MTYADGILALDFCGWHYGNLSDIVDPEVCNFICFRIILLFTSALV